MDVSLMVALASSSFIHSQKHKQELHAGHLEEQLLNQVQVVFPGEVLAVWILQNTLIRIRIGWSSLSTYLLHVLLPCFVAMPSLSLIRINGHKGVDFRQTWA